MPESSEGAEGTKPEVEEGTKPEVTKEPKTYTQEEFDALHTRMTAADRNKTAEQKKAEELQSKLDAIEADKLSEVEKLKLAKDKSEAEKTAALADLNATRMENAFLKSGVEWADADDAMTLLTNSKKYSDLIEKDDKGNVTSVAAAVKLLAKDKPHLLKTNVGPSSEATGSSSNTKRKGEDKGNANNEALLVKYPAARKR